ncbi:hypothetical protein ACFQ4O_07515 [Methylopila musalis]|uniref:Uncharacterized protein n=1 Tax=Methylopila musalis TaxID=1134781 RepID=A0ABW3Z7W6_9HYPH
MRSDVCDALAEQQLLVFKALDFRFERSHDRRDGRLDDPLDILPDLFFDIGERRAQRCGFLLDVRLFALPQILEHRAREFNDLRARLRRA